MNEDAIQQQVEQERQNQHCSHHGQPDQLYTYNSAQGMYIRNIQLDILRSTFDKINLWWTVVAVY